MYIFNEACTANSTVVYISITPQVIKGDESEKKRKYTCMKMEEA